MCCTEKMKKKPERTTCAIILSYFTLNGSCTFWNFIQFKKRISINYNGSFHKEITNQFAKSVWKITKNTFKFNTKKFESISKLKLYFIPPRNHIFHEIQYKIGTLQSRSSFRSFYLNKNDRKLRTSFRKSPFTAPRKWAF